MDTDRVIRPAAVVNDQHARELLAELARQDVARGGMWSATSSLWQRYDVPWNGPLGARGDAECVGSIFVTYDAPARHWVTIYRVAVTEHGRKRGFTVDSLCDELLRTVGLSLATCPRADLVSAPVADPFRRRLGSR